MPCLRHRSLADIPAACSFSTLMICSSVNLPLRIVRLLGGEQNPNLKPGAFQGSRSLDPGHWPSFGLKRVPLTNFNATSDCVPISFESRLCFGEIHAMNTR